MKTEDTKKENSQELHKRNYDLRIRPNTQKI